MTCPKCQGLLVPDPFWYVIDYQRIRCVNCGLHITKGWPVNLPPFQAEEDHPGRKPVLLPVPLYRDRMGPKREAYNAYMRHYMQTYRKRRTNGHNGHQIPTMMSRVL
jgi:hypothetical protein